MSDKKYGRMKKKCEKYKNTGKRAINKDVKKKREEKRQERFKLRREEGKAYEYEPNPYDQHSKSRAERRKFYAERRRRAEKNASKRLPLAHETSMMRKLQNMLDKEKKERKLFKTTRRVMQKLEEDAV